MGFCQFHAFNVKIGAFRPQQLVMWFLTPQRICVQELYKWLRSPRDPLSERGSSPVWVGEGGKLTRKLRSYIIINYDTIIYKTIIILPSSMKFCPVLLFWSVHEKLSTLFYFFGKWSPLSTNSLHSHSIIKLIYKCRILIPLTFSTHFYSHFLKLMPSQIWTIFHGRRGRSIILHLSKKNTSICGRH